MNALVGYESDPEDSPGTLGKERVRVFGHVVGHWATHVYIRIDVDSVTSDLFHKVLLQYGISQMEEQFHVSLSRTIVLLRGRIEEFVERIAKVASGFSR